MYQHYQQRETRQQLPALADEPRVLHAASSAAARLRPGACSPCPLCVGVVAGAHVGAVDEGQPPVQQVLPHLVPASSVEPAGHHSPVSEALPEAVPTHQLNGAKWLRGAIWITEGRSCRNTMRQGYRIEEGSLP
jgi:hypothetical protein